MMGFKVEPGERTALVMSTAPNRALVEQAGRADVGDHLAGAMVDHDHRGGQAAAQRVGVLAGQLLEVGLHGGIDGQAMYQARLALLDLGVGEVRGEHREFTAHGRHALASRAPRLVGGDHAVGRRIGKHAIAGAPRGLGETVGRRSSGDCGSATSRAASASDRRRGSLPK